MICRSCIEDQTARCTTCISDPSPAEALPAADLFPTVTSCKPMAKTLALQHLASRAYGFGHLPSFFKKANVIQMGGRVFQRHVSLHRPRYGRQNHRHDCRRRQILSLATMIPRLLRGTARSATKSGPHEIPDMLITSRDIRVQKLKSCGKNPPRKPSRKKPFADLEPVWGKGPHQRPTSSSKSSI